MVPWENEYFLTSNLLCSFINMKLCPLVILPAYIFRCLHCSIFQIHVAITISSSAFLSTYSNHLSLTSLIFSLTFATPALALISSVLIFSILYIPTPIIHLRILVSVFSSLSCWALLSVQVSLWYIGTGLVMYPWFQLAFTFLIFCLHSCIVNLLLHFSPSHLPVLNR